MGLRNLRVKSVALLSLLFTIAFSSQVWSIGLGEINLKSPLNAPLDAEIHLLQVNDLGENEILVNLAPQADFDRAGVPRRFFLRNIKFKLDLNNEKGPLIKVFSHEAIQEPYLNFIVEVMWPNGRLLREYVVLMDLPAVDGSGIARPVRVNRQKQLSDDELMADIPEKYKVSASAAKRTSSSVEPVEPTAVGSAGDVYGPVQSNETLWAIAQKTLPEQGMSIQQAMLAIQRLNPDAFINGNINLLKKGVVLRLPTAADIRATTAREAISEVALQNAEWRGASAQIDASSTAKKMEPAGLDESDRLTLVAPGAEEDGVFGSGLGDEESVDLTEGDDFVSGDISADGVDVEEGLEAGSVQDAAMLEEMDRIARENEALKSDLGKLEEQLSTVDEILDVQNADMDAIEESIKQLASEKAVEKPRKVESADVPATDESDPIDFYLVFKILMVFVVVIGIFVFYSRKRAASTRESDVELDWEEPVQETEVEEAVEEVVSAQPPVKEEKKPVVAEPETEDAIGEADIYISFGNFEKAEALLLSAIAAEPARNDLRLKLLEVLVETRDLAKFDQQLAEIRSSQDANAVARAEALRSKIAGDEATVEDSLDIDLGLDAETKPLEEEAFVESTTPETSLEDEFDIDLSLDADESSASDLSPALQDEVVEEGAAQEDEFDLDLSSDFMESETPVESVQTEAEVAPSADELVDEFIEEALEEQGVTEDQIVEEAAEMIEEPSEIVEEVEQAQPPVAQEEEAELLDEDETATKLELAKAYMDMGDTEGAKDILEEVLEEGSAAQKEEAQSLMNELG